MLVNRLKVVLPYLVSPNQSVFLEGRQIVDFVVVAHESLHSKFISEEAGIVCKLDFS